MTNEEAIKKAVWEAEKAAAMAEGSDDAAEETAKSGETAAEEKSEGNGGEMKAEETGTEEAVTEGSDAGKTGTEETDAGEPGEETAAGDEEEQEIPDEESAGTDGEKKSKKNFFRKKDKKDKKDEKIAELTDRLQRQLAEFDNFRKRTEKEKSSMYQIGAKDVIEKILPVVDNFERGLQTGDENDPFVEGMSKTYKQLTTVLKDLGVTPIEAVGREFNADLHNAVMHVEDESVGENIVVEEFQKGYMYKDSVVRYSMVKVAN